MTHLEDYRFAVIEGELPHLKNAAARRLSTKSPAFAGDFSHLKFKNFSIYAHLKRFYGIIEVSKNRWEYFYDDSGQ